MVLSSSQGMDSQVNKIQGSNIDQLKVVLFFLRLCRRKRASVLSARQVRKQSLAPILRVVDIQDESSWSAKSIHTDQPSTRTLRYTLEPVCRRYGGKGGN